MKYELICGLETHVELATKTKIFCGCTTAFGSGPNENCCPGCMAFPGTLPVMNRAVVDYAMRAGLALGCAVSPRSEFMRKSYFYPDLPKGYQVTQFWSPICLGGGIELSNGRFIRIHHIHIEEDAGKLVHRGGDMYVDCNRGGVPLIEIVTEADFRSAAEVREYLETLQMTLRYAAVSDCRMEEGSMRCDVNISVRPEGSEKLGVRAEIKNMNSLSFIEKAIEYECGRQVDAIESGEILVQQTRRYDEASGTTEAMREKENAQDYRYFPDPDFVPIVLTEAEIEAARDALPELPQAKRIRYVNTLGLSAADASQLVKFRAVAEYFDRASEGLTASKNAANLILGQMFRRAASEGDKENFAPPVPAAELCKLCKYIEDGKLSASLAKATLEQMLDSGEPVSAFLKEADLAGFSAEELEKLCAEAIAAHPAAVADLRAGKAKAMGALVGFVMKNSRGRAPAPEAEKRLREMIAAN